MAKADLIKGIDNTCEAVRKAVRRADAGGVVWRPRPPLQGIDNGVGDALRRRTAKGESATAGDAAPLHLEALQAAPGRDP